MMEREFSEVYEAILLTPGMKDVIKIDLRISRENVLVLSSIIQRGIKAKDSDKSFGVLSNVSKETLEELRNISQECLEKSALAQLHEKLNSFTVTKE